MHSSTVVSFVLEEVAQVHLAIYNQEGKEVATLLEARVECGNHEISFDASELPSGTYYYTLRTNDNTVLTKKLQAIH